MIARTSQNLRPPTRPKSAFALALEEALAKKRERQPQAASGGRMTRSLNAAERKRERWHFSPSPRANTVRPMLFVGPQSRLPDAPCFRCGARGGCEHRELTAVEL